MDSAISTIDTTNETIAPLNTASSIPIPPASADAAIAELIARSSATESANDAHHDRSPVNTSDFTGLWGWMDTLEVVLTVAMFVPGLNAVAGAVVAYRAVSIAVRAVKLVLEVSKAVLTGKKLNVGITATEKAGQAAGRIWTGFTKGAGATKKATPRWINTRLGTQYRHFEAKDYSRTVANFEKRPPGPKGQWLHNVHVDKKGGSFWNQ